MIALVDVTNHIVLLLKMISGINKAQFLRVTIESICTIVRFIWLKPMLMNTKSDIWVLLFTLIQWCLLH